MAIQQKQVDYAKESDDVMVLLIGLVKGIKAKKSAADLASSELAALMDAISGADQIPAEEKASPVVELQTVGYRFGELVAAIVEPSA